MLQLHTTSARLQKIWRKQLGKLPLDPRVRGDDGNEGTSKSAISIALVMTTVLISALSILQLHNIASYPVKKGFDGLDHAQYIQIISKERRLPLANEGWETYQPPLYYLIASVLPSVKSVQYLGFATWLGLCGLVYVFIRKKFGDRQSALLSVALVGSLPMVLYLTPMVSNEFFSGVVMNGVLVYYTCFYDAKQVSTRRSDVILGTLLGLSLLSKATSVVLLASICLDVLISHRFNMQKVLYRLRWVLAVAFLISGWFYIRNIYHFGNPFASSIDFLPSTVFDQDPGYRDLRFFLDPMGFLKLDIFYAHHYSLWAGTYFSWFFDGHTALLPVQEFSKAGVVLVLASVPITIMTVRGVLRSWHEGVASHRIMWIYPVLLFLAYVAYNFRLPYYSTVKAIFLTSTIIPWIYFTIYGIRTLPKGKYLSWGIWIFITLYVCIVTKNFWIVGWWYDYMK